MNTLFRDQVERNLNYWATQVRLYGNCDEEAVMRAVEFGWMYREFQQYAVSVALCFLDSRETLLFSAEWLKLFETSELWREHASEPINVWSLAVKVRLLQLAVRSGEALYLLREIYRFTQNEWVGKAVDSVLLARLAQASFMVGDFALAEQFAFQALLVDNSRDFALPHLVLGEVRLSQGEYLESKDFFESGLCSGVDLQSTFIEVRLNACLARAHFLLGNSRKALILAGKAATVAKQYAWEAQYQNAQELRILVRTTGGL